MRPTRTATTCVPARLGALARHEDRASLLFLRELLDRVKVRLSYLYSRPPDSESREETPDKVQTPVEDDRDCRLSCSSLALLGARRGPSLAYGFPDAPTEKPPISLLGGRESNGSLAHVLRLASSASSSSSSRWPGGAQDCHDLLFVAKVGLVPPLFCLPLGLS